MTNEKCELGKHVWAPTTDGYGKPLERCLKCDCYQAPYTLPAWTHALPSMPGRYWYVAVNGPGESPPNCYHAPELVLVTEENYDDYPMQRKVDRMCTTVRKALVIHRNSLREWDWWLGPIACPALPAQLSGLELTDR